jgi:hypothetical protein
MRRLKNFKRLPSPAAVIGILALILALSGVAVALPGKNSVATKDLKKNAVTAAKLKNGAVTGPKLGAGSVTTDKLAAEAATGAKVDEASLGKVPTAGHADTATKATEATKAVTADSAAKATEATNALELEGRTLSQVRPTASGTSDNTSQGLDAVDFENVMGTTITIPPGGADVVINASFDLDNNSAGQAGGTCRLKFSGSVVSFPTFITMAAGNNYSVSLTAFVNSAGAGVRQALVECQGSIADDDIRFEGGDLAVEAFPVGV